MTISLRACGADPSASSDSTGAILTAIGQARNQGGGMIDCEPGTYRADGQLWIPTDAMSTGPGNPPGRQPFIQFHGAGGLDNGSGGTRFILNYQGPGAKIVSTGNGSIAFERLGFWSQINGDTTPFMLLTNTRADVERCTFRGTRWATYLWPYSIVTNQWPTQDAIRLGDASGQVDASLSGGFQGYITRITGNLFYSVARAVMGQNNFTTTIIDGNYVTSSCGSPGRYGAAFVSINGEPSASNNNLWIARNQIEGLCYAAGVYLAANTNGCHIGPNQYPDTFARTRLAARTLAGSQSIVTAGWFPTMDLAPYLQSYQFALDWEPLTELVRFTSCTPSGQTTLAGPAGHGTRSVQVTDATGIVAGTAILLDSTGVYGGVQGCAGMMEPAVVDAGYTGGTTIPLRDALWSDHSAGVTVGIGPFTFGLDGPLHVTHVANTPLTTAIAAAVCDKGTWGNFVETSGQGSAMGMLDLDGRNEGRVSLAAGSMAHSGHVALVGGMPDVTPGAAAGSGATATVTPESCDTAGRIMLTMGTAPGAGALCAVRFHTPFNRVPIILPSSPNGVIVGHSAPSTAGFTFWVNSPLGAGITYTLSWLAVEAG